MSEGTDEPAVPAVASLELRPEGDACGLDDNDVGMEDGTPSSSDDGGDDDDADDDDGDRDGDNNGEAAEGASKKVGLPPSHDDDDDDDDDDDQSSASKKGTSRRRTLTNKFSNFRARMFSKKMQARVEEKEMMQDNRWMHAMEMASSRCLMCAGQFHSVTNPRYHCRCCYLAVCGDCSARRLKNQETLRVCSSCFEINEHHAAVKLSLRPAPYPVRSGRMVKCGAKYRNWTSRAWFLDSNGLLSYFGDDLAKPKGTLNTCILDRCIPRDDDDLAIASWPKKNCPENARFGLAFPRRKMFMYLENAETTESWRAAISKFAMQCVTCGYHLFEKNDPTSHIRYGNKSRRATLSFRSSATSSGVAKEVRERAADASDEGDGDGNSEQPNPNPVAHTHADADPTTPSESNDKSGKRSSECRAQDDQVYALECCATACHIGCLVCAICKAKLNPAGSDDDGVYQVNAVLLCRSHAVKWIKEQQPPSLSKDDQEIRAAQQLQSLRPQTMARVSVDEYLALRNKVLRRDAYEVAQVVEAKREEEIQRKKKAAKSQAIDENKVISEEAGVQVTPHIVSCAIWGIKESLSATAVMVQQGTLAQCSDTVRRKTSLPNGQSYEVIDHHPAKFQKLRDILDIPLAVYQGSFEEMPDVRDKISGGRSGSLVLPTSDEEFIVKTIPKIERDSLIKILDSYIDHMETFPFSLLVKFVGLYEIKTSSSQYQCFVVMRNVLKTDVKLHEIYDLKGSFVGRTALNTLKNKDDPFDYSGVRKDNDLRRSFRVGIRGKEILSRQLKADAYYLNKHGLMDYSMLVGVHNCERDGSCCAQRKGSEIETVDEKTKLPKLRESDIAKHGVRGKGPEDLVDVETESVYFFGIIDVLQPWTNKKKMENVAKRTVHDKDAISAVNSDDYTQRFIHFGVARLTDT